MIWTANLQCGEKNSAPIASSSGVSASDAQSADEGALVMASSCEAVAVLSMYEAAAASLCCVKKIQKKSRGLRKVVAQLTSKFNIKCWMSDRNGKFPGTRKAMQLLANSKESICIEVRNICAVRPCQRILTPLCWRRSFKCSTGEIVLLDDADGATAPETLRQKDRAARTSGEWRFVRPPKGSRHRHRCASETLRYMDRWGIRVDSNSRRCSTFVWTMSCRESPESVLKAWASPSRTLPPGNASCSKPGRVVVLP